MQRALWLVVLASLVLAAPGQAALGSNSTPDRLWLRGPTLADPEHNFTTFAPNATEAEPLLAWADQPEGREWRFVMARSPSPWTFKADAEVRALIVLENLAAAVPLPSDPFDPLTYPSFDPQQVAITVGLYQGTSADALASGTESIELEPGKDAGTISLDVPMTGSAEVPLNDQPGDAPNIVLTITIHARFPAALTDMYGEPVVLVGGKTHASWVAIEGFPYEPFRAWDEHNRIQEACQPFYLQALACPHEAATAAPVQERENRESPGTAGALVALLAVGVLSLARPFSRQCAIRNLRHAENRR